MRTSALAAMVLMFGVWHGTALGQTSIERIEQRVRYLEDRVAAQDRTIVEKDKQISRLESLGDGWFTNVELGGAVEVELVSEKDFEGVSSNGLDAATVDVGVAAQVNDWVAADIALTMDDDGKIEVDEAIMTITPPDSPVSVITGRQGVPFGVYKTSLVSDPLTMDLGDTADDALQLALEHGNMTGAAFLFKGDNDRGGDDQIQNFGVLGRLRN